MKKLFIVLFLLPIAYVYSAPKDGHYYDRETKKCFRFEHKTFGKNIYVHEPDTERCFGFYWKEYTKRQGRKSSVCEVRFWELSRDQKSAKHIEAGHADGIGFQWYNSNCRGIRQY